MKFFLIPLFFINGFFSFGINDVTKLDKTIAYFAEVIQSKKELPAEFNLTYQETINLNKLVEPNVSKEKIDKSFEYLVGKNNQQYSRVAKFSKYLKQLISYDTITFTQRGIDLPLINISFLFSLNQNGEARYKVDNKRISVKFFIISGSLKMAQSARIISKLHFELNELDIVKSKNEKRYSNIINNRPFIDFEAISSDDTEKINEISLSTLYSESKKYNVIWSKSLDTSGYSHYIINALSQDTISRISGFDYLDKFGDFFKGAKNDTTFVLNNQGKSVFSTQFTSKTESPGYMILYDRTTRLFGIYCPYTGLIIEPKYRLIEPIKRDKFFMVITTSGKLVYLDRTGKRLFD